MTTKPNPEALAYIEHRLKDRKFALTMLAKLIVKHCEPEKLNPLVEKWKASKAASTTPSITTTTTTTPINKPVSKAPSPTAKVEKAKSGTSIKAPNDWVDFSEPRQSGDD